MHRFYLAPENWNPDALALIGAEAHHCRNVLRLESGDKVVVFDGRGRELTAAGSRPANDVAVLSAPPSLRSSTDRLAPIRRRPSQENPGGIFRRTWRPTLDRSDAGRSQRGFHPRRTVARAQPRLSPDHVGPDRSSR